MYSIKYPVINSIYSGQELCSYSLIFWERALILKKLLRLGGYHVCIHGNLLRPRAHRRTKRWWRPLPGVCALRHFSSSVRLDQ